MHVSLDEKTVVRAFLHCFGKSSTFEKLCWSLSLVVWLILTVVVWMWILEPVDHPVEFVGDLALLVFILYVWHLVVFNDGIARRRARKWLGTAHTLDLEIKYSNDEIEIIDNTNIRRYRWKDLKAWCDIDGVLLLCPRRKLLAIRQVFHIVDLNQVTEEEQSSFRRLLTTRVRPCALGGRR